MNGLVSTGADFRGTVERLCDGCRARAAEPGSALCQGCKTKRSLAHEAATHTIGCPHCSRRLRDVHALARHARDKHGVT